MRTVTDPAEMVATFVERAHGATYCSLSTVDRKGRPRSRLVHPLWDGTTGWVTSRRTTPKAQHLAANPHVSCTYISDLARPVTVDGIAEWVDDEATRRWFWEWAKTVPAPAGFDPNTIFPIDSPDSGLLKITATRITLLDLVGGDSVRWTRTEI